MNIIIEGPDAVGKSSLYTYLKHLYNIDYHHSSSKTKNDLQYHLDELNKHNTLFDRFHLGEIIYSKLYGREPKISLNDLDIINEKIISNGDIFIIMYSSDISILKQRLIERKEFEFLEGIEQQNNDFMQFAKEYSKLGYDKFIFADISESNCYDKLYSKVEKFLTEASDIDVVYREVCRDLLKASHLTHIETATRGDSCEINNYMFTINDVSGDVVALKSRNTSLTYLAAETLWYWAGRNDVDFIGKFAKLWTKISDDGITNNSAYGYILQKKHGFNQIEKIIELLKFDRQSRRAVLNINVPNENVISTKDEMCTIALNFYIRDDKLNCTAIMRSNDVIFGLTYDLTYFIQLQKYIANKVGVEVGSYTHFATSMHFYSVDYDKVKAIANGPLTLCTKYLDTNKLISGASSLIHYIDNNFTSKEAFEELLINSGIIRYA